jgi:hypothetical protein
MMEGEWDTGFKETTALAVENPAPLPPLGGEFTNQPTLHAGKCGNQTMGLKPGIDIHRGHNCSTKFG